MSIQTFFNSLTSTSHRRPTPQRLPALRLRFEPLEDRRLLSFAPGVEYAVGANPQAVATADFNYDGRLDVATANLDSNVSVLLGNAGGTFQPALNSPTGLPLLSLAVGDFNADGKLDLATTNPAGASTLLGNGNGTFQAPTNINLGSTPTSLGVGDFNGDGKLDLAVTTQTYYQAYYPYIIGGMHNSNAHVLLGNGGGSFSTPTVVPLDSYWGYYFEQHRATSLVSDFNGDGKQDFAFGNSQNGIIALSLGTVSGLGAPTVFPSAPALAMAAGDVNADGKLDLVTKNFTGNDGRLFLGNGAGSFAPALAYAARAPSNSLAIADFNADSKADLVMANGDAGTVSVLLGTGAGTFRPPVTSAAGSHPYGVAVGDFNGDGRRDVATAVATGNSNSVSVLLNDGIWPALDAPFITINDVSVTEGNSGTTPATFTVRLSAAYGQTVAVHYATVDASATLAGGDYQAASGELTFAPGVTSRTVTVLVNGDRLAAESESFYVRLTNPTNAIVTDALGAGGILDDEPYVSMGGNVQVSEGNTGTTSAVYTVTLSRVYDTPVSVNFSTAEGDTHFEGGGGPYGYYYYSQPAATSGIDFQSQTGTLTFAPGQTSKNITVAVNGDRLAESWESFSVDLSSPSANAALADDHALGTIADNEPRITVNSTQVVEGNSGTTDALITLSMEAASDGPVTVNWSTADGGGGAVAGSDYLASSGTATFPLGGPLTQTIAVPILGDRLFEYYPEAFYVNLDNGYWEYVTILDDEPRISISSYVWVDEGDTGTTPAIFTVSLAYAYDQPVSINFSTSEGGSDIQSASGSLTFAAGQTSKNITVLVNGDTLIEQDESFRVVLSGASANAFISNDGIGIIVDDDTPVTKFYVVDASSDKTFEYAAGGQSVENYRLRSGNNDPRGAASDASGERVWVIDNNDNVYAYDDAGYSLGYWKAKGLSEPEGIASDGTDIWIVDRGTDRVYRYAGAANRTSGSAIATSSFALNSGNKDARGIETDGTHLWVVNDASTNKVFKYTLSGALVGSWTISGTNTTPTGLTLDPSNPSDIWIVDAGRDQVFQYTAAAGRTSGSQSAAAVFNLAAGNTNPQGIADPPPPVGQASSPIQSNSAFEPSRTARLAKPTATADTTLILLQQPKASVAGSAQTFARSESISEFIRGDQEQEYFHRKAFHAYDAVFADAERLGDILIDDGT